MFLLTLPPPAVLPGWAADEPPVPDLDAPVAPEVFPVFVLLGFIF